MKMFFELKKINMKLINKTPSLFSSDLMCNNILMLRNSYVEKGRIS